MDDGPHLRLGLIMLDSAAELLLHRECDSRLKWAGEYRRLVRDTERWRERMGRETGTLAELREKAVPAAQYRRIDRDFGAKCDYLLGFGVLAEPHARVLKKLHKYRNEAYHRDHLRRGTLASATRIYAYLVCSLMRDFPMQSISYQSTDPPAGLLKYLTAGERGMELWDALPGLQARIASRLLGEVGLARPPGVGEVLSRHFCDRLDAVREAAEESAAFFRRPGRDEGWDWQAALGLAQLDIRNLPRIPSPDDARSAASRYAPSTSGNGGRQARRSPHKLTTWPRSRRSRTWKTPSSHWRRSSCNSSPRSRSSATLPAGGEGPCRSSTLPFPCSKACTAPLRPSRSGTRPRSAASSATCSCQSRILPG